VLPAAQAVLPAAQAVLSEARGAAVSRAAYR